MNIPLIIGALAVSFFLMWGLLGILKTTLKTALIVAVIVFGLQLVFKISPHLVFNQAAEFTNGIGNGITQWFSKWGNKQKPPSDFGKQSMLRWFIESIFA